MEICSEIAIDVRPDQCIKCMGDVAVFVVAAIGAFLRKISVRHHVFEQLIVRTVGQATSTAVVDRLVRSRVTRR